MTDKYSILSRVIGAGQFAVVRQAFNQQTNQKCAAKEVANKLLGCSEAKLLQQLNHPHIVNFFDAFELVDSVVLVMELVSEGELLEYIVSKDNLTEAVCVRYLTQLLHALDYLSQKNIVHLDIKVRAWCRSGFVRISIIQYIYVTLTPSHSVLFLSSLWPVASSRLSSPCYKLLPH